MTLKQRAIVAYEAAQEAKRETEAEAERQRRDAHVVRLQNLVRQILNPAQDDLPIAWCTVPQYAGEFPVFEADGMCFTCNPECASEFDKVLLMTFRGNINNREYTDRYVYDLSTLGKELQASPILARIEGNHIVPAE